MLRSACYLAKFPQKDSIKRAKNEHLYKSFSQQGSLYYILTKGEPFRQKNEEVLPYGKKEVRQGHPVGKGDLWFGRLRAPYRIYRTLLNEPKRVPWRVRGGELFGVSKGRLSCAGSAQSF